jgi:hypothetical protein
MKKAFGWKDGDKFYVSLYPKPIGEKKRPANSYDSQTDAIREAEQRGMSVEWQQ